MPKNILRTGRLSKDMSPIVEKFLTSVKDDIKISFYDVLGTQVHNIMLIEEGIVDPQDGSIILAELQKIKEEILAGTIEYDLTYEDIHPLIEDRVINMVGIEIGGKLHSGRSRNDQVVLDIKLKIRDDLIVIAKKLIYLGETLMDLARKNSIVICPLYTHLQRAQIGTFSHYFLAYIEELNRHLSRIWDCLIRVNSNPLGAGAVGGTSIPINRQRTTDLLGFDSIQLNSLDAVSSRDYTLELISIYAIIATFISRIAEDLVIWSSAEFKYITFDDAYSSVSSALPQKKNSDTAELLRAKSSEIIGKAFGVFTMQKSLYSGYNRDFQQIKPQLWDSQEILSENLDILIGILSSMEIHPEIMEQATKEGNLIALDIAEYLVLNNGISFRMAHGIMGEIVQHNPQDLTNSEIIASVAKDKFDLDLAVPQVELEKYNDPVYCLASRKSLGNPSPDQQEYMIELFNRELEDFSRKFKEKAEFFQLCFKKVNDLINDFTKNLP